MNPRFVLFDEPFAGVDPMAISALKKTLRGLAEQGIGVLVTDHAVHETLTGCDRAVILDGGCVVASGTPDEVAENETRPLSWCQLPDAWLCAPDVDINGALGSKTSQISVEDCCW